MDDFNDAIAFLKEHEREPGNRKKLRATSLAKLRREFPGIPEDYLDYMGLIGAGTFRECQYATYAKLGWIAEHFDERWTDKFGKNILIFGHNFAGDNGCFVIDQNWAVADVWHDDSHIHLFKGTFGQYIRAKMLMGPDGKDQRE